MLLTDRRRFRVSDGPINYSLVSARVRKFEFGGVAYPSPALFHTPSTSVVSRPVQGKRRIEQTFGFITILLVRMISNQNSSPFSPSSSALLIPKSLDHLLSRPRLD